MGRGRAEGVESAGIYEHALRLWEGLEAELDCSIAFSQRGVLNLAHSLGDIREGRRRINANQLNGMDAQWLGPDEVQKLAPIIDISTGVRYPVLGATYQPRAGIAKHDWVAWGYARAAHEMGVDLIQGCEVTGLLREGERVVGVDTAGGPIRADRVALAAAGTAASCRPPLVSACRCRAIRCSPWSPSCSSRSLTPSSCPTRCS